MLPREIGCFDDGAPLWSAYGRRSRLIQDAAWSLPVRPSRWSASGSTRLERPGYASAWFSPAYRPPECNLIIGDDQGPIGRVDLVCLTYKLIIEYEGDQHRTDRRQWNADIDRYEDIARDKWTLIRITSARARWPRQVVRNVDQALRANGYEGPEPDFGELWISLFE